MTTYILDTETTGWPEAELEAIELAYAELKLDAGPLRYGTIWAGYYKPEREILAAARAAHNILDQELEGCPPSDTARIPGDAEYIVAHNVDYDWHAIGCPDVKRICTLALCRRYYPGGSHSIGSMMYRLLAQQEAKLLLTKAHSAKADLRCCAVILAALLEKLPQVTSWESLWSISEDAREPLEWTFGKYKGQSIESTPSDYLRWGLANMTEADQYLRRKMARVLEERNKCKPTEGSVQQS